MRSPWFALLLPLVAVSCAELPGFKADKETEIGPLAEAFEYYEVLDQGEGSWNIPPDRHLAEVDFKSKVVVVPDKEKLTEIAGGARSVLENLSPATRKRLENVDELIQQAQTYVDQVDSFLGELREVRSSGGQPSAEGVQRLKEQSKAQADLGLELLQIVEEVATSRARMELPAGSEDAIIERADAMVEPLLVSSDGEDVVLNVEAFAVFVREEIAFAEERAERDRRRAETAGKARLRIRAFRKRGGERLPVHVENYDEIEEPNPVKERVSLLLTGEDRERLEKEFKITRDAARLIRDVRDRNSRLRQGLRDLRAGIESDLEDLPELNRETILGAVEQGTSAALSFAIDSQRTSAAEKEALRRLQGSLTALRDAGAPDIGDPKAAIKLALGSPESIRGASPVDTLASFTDRVDSLLTGFRTLGDVSGRVIEEIPASNALRASFARALPRTLQGLEELRAETLARYEGVVTLLEEFTQRARMESMADAFDPSVIDPTVKELPIEDALPASINLNNLEIDRGDELEILTELVTDEEGEETVKGRTFNLTIERFGVSSKLAAHLILVDRRGSGEAGDPEIEFDPAPSVSWTLHYKFRTEPEKKDSPLRFWNFVDPGIGVNVAAIDFEDENFQVGIGVHATVFSDLFSAGYGYNLNAERDNDYFYVGIGLLEALNVVGTTTSRMLPSLASSEQ